MSVKPKEWRVGIADEAWKVSICARDAALARDLLSGLIHILTDAGSDTERGLSELRKMSGDQVVSALESYHRKAIASVERALKRNAKP